MGNMGTCRSTLEGALQVEDPRGVEYRVEHGGGPAGMSNESW